jgi:FdrA protein
MTVVLNQILKHTYNDSIILMQNTVELESLPGVIKAAIMMGTPGVLQSLKESNLLVEDENNISSDDMIIAVEGETEGEVKLALEKITKRLLGGEILSKSSNTTIGASLEESYGLLWRDIPVDVSLSLISTPGLYAAAEAWRAVKSNRHVMIFSNNVSIEDEIALKKSGLERNLLVMGPDCGTAIINGVPLGFANVVKRGNIGVIAGAGSGLQELTCLIDRMGCGISHAIGTGGRDLSSKVKGITTKLGLGMLGDDKGTDVIALLSKPPDPQIAAEVIEVAKCIGKPIAVCLLGMESKVKNDGQIYFAETIDELANLTVSLATQSEMKREVYSKKIIQNEDIPLNQYIRGFFSGGTLAYETLYLLKSEIGGVYSNISKDPEFICVMEDLEKPRHIILDLGTEEFTTGRPHPMIDGRWRAELIKSCGRNEKVKVVLFDLILGLGADSNPASTISGSIQEARKEAEANGRELIFIASIIGTEEDPQPYSDQFNILKNAGVIITKSNAEAARLAFEKLSKLS